MATLAAKQKIHVEAHYVYGAFVGLVAGAVMAMPAMLYTTITGSGFWALGWGISEAFVSLETAQTSGGIFVGLMIHMMLSAMVGVGAAILSSNILKKRVEGGLNLLPVRLGIGVVIWAVNWYIVLPIIDPGFIELLPHVPALLFHLLFGYTLGLYGRVAIRVVGAASVGSGRTAA